MITSALAFTTLVTPALPIEEFSVDVFLVANNPTLIQNLDWLKESDLSDPIQQKLSFALRPLIAAKQSFVVIDGGDCTVFPKEGQREASALHRTFSGSATKSVTKKGRTTTTIIVRTETVTTTMSGMNIRQVGPLGYVSQHPMDFNTEPANKISVVLQDLNSYCTAATSKVASEKEAISKSLLVSANSMQTSKRFLKENNLQFNGVCISSWGLPDPKEPNFISFPPSGRAAHYQMFRRSGKWGIRFLEYLQ